MSKQNTFLRSHVPTLFLPQPTSFPPVPLANKSDDDGNDNNNNNNNNDDEIKTIVSFVESMHTVHLEDIKCRSSADFIDFIFTANRNQLTYNTAVRI